MKIRNGILVGVLFVLSGVMFGSVQGMAQDKDAVKEGLEVAKEEVVGEGLNTVTQTVESETETAAEFSENVAPVAPAETVAEQAVPAEPAVKVPPVRVPMDDYPPQIELSKWGSMTQIVVTTNPGMPAEKIPAIQAMKLESPKGDFLGLRTYNADETERRAKFLVNKEVLKIEEAKLTVTSSLDGDWVKTLALKLPEDLKEGEAVSEATGKVQPPVSKKQEAPKKKGWWW